MKEYTAKEALQIARKHGLEAEIRYELDVLGSHPNDALLEWDLLIPEDCEEPEEE